MKMTVLPLPLYNIYYFLLRLVHTNEGNDPWIHKERRWPLYLTGTERLLETSIQGEAMLAAVGALRI